MEFPENEIISFGEINSNNTQELIKFFVSWNPPEIFFFPTFLNNATQFCGPLVKMIAELGQRYHYRYRL